MIMKKTQYNTTTIDIFITIIFSITFTKCVIFICKRLFDHRVAAFIITDSIYQLMYVSLQNLSFVKSHT